MNGRNLLRRTLDEPNSRVRNTPHNEVVRARKLRDTKMQDETAMNSQQGLPTMSLCVEIRIQLARPPAVHQIRTRANIKSFSPL